jgi:trimeric autotransporter adhesin
MKKIFACIGLALATQYVHAQVGIGTASPNSSAQLEISSVNKGLLIPRITMTNRPASPATGLLIYQTDNTPGYYYYDGTAWKMLEITGNSWGLNGNSGVTTSNFIGTTNTYKLNFKVNNVASGIIDGSGNNTALGYEALLSNTAFGNTAIGYQALKGNTTTNYSTAVGFRALSVNNGYANSAFGGVVLSKNTTGTNNVGLGSNALQDNVSGSYNVAVGVSALLSQTTNNNNVAVGYGALSSISGDDNTAIGYSAGPIGAFNNTTSLGSGAAPTASNMVRIGNSAVTSIGGYAGWSNLSDIRFKKDVAPQTHGLDFIMKLQPIVYHLDVEKLNAFTYGGKSPNLIQNASYKEVSQKKESILYSGFSAQQVEEAANTVGYSFSAVHRPESEKDHYSLDYSSFVVPLVKAMQEQQQQIEQLKKDQQNSLHEMEALRREIKWLKDNLKQ